MTAAPAGAGAAVAWPRPRVPALFPILAFKVPRLSRRRSVAVPLCRRLPRLLGTGLTLAFFGAVAITGCVIGGQYQAFREEYGEPHHVLARTIGFRI